MNGQVGEASPECGNFNHDAERDAPQVRHRREHDGMHSSQTKGSELLQLPFAATPLKK